MTNVVRYMYQNPKANLTLENLILEDLTLEDLILEDLTLEDLTAQFDLSRSYLNAIFRKYQDMRPSWDIPINIIFTYFPKVRRDVFQGISQQ